MWDKSGEICCLWAMTDGAGNKRIVGCISGPGIRTRWRDTKVSTACMLGLGISQKAGEYIYKLFILAQFFVLSYFVHQLTIEFSSFVCTRCFL